MVALVRSEQIEVNTPDGRITVDLAAMGAGPDNLFVSADTGRTDALAGVESLAWPYAELQVRSNGVHFRPQPWEGSTDPVTVHVRAAFESGESRGTARVFSFPEPALVHTVRHDMGTRHFIERIISDTGEQQYAGITIVSDDEFRVELTEAQPITMSVVFLT